MKIEDILKMRNSHLGFRIASHTTFWLVLFSSSYFLILYSFDVYRSSPMAYLTPLRHIISLIAVFYPLMYFVLPAFTQKPRWVSFFLGIVILTFVYVFIEAAGEKMVFHYCDSCLQLGLQHNPEYISVIQKNIFHNILFKASNFQLFLQMASSLILPIAIKISLSHYQLHTKNLELEREKVRLELNFLKAQVNPHFLFNTLNNLYGLIILERKEQSIHTVKRLSDFLRYTLDNAHQNEIQLEEEIELITNYVELERLRLNHTDVELEIEVSDPRKAIPPLIYIPLLENAFKYNIDRPNSHISIHLSMKDNLLYFKIQNGFDDAKKASSQGGLGLKNLEKRLKLYFGDKYVYKVRKQDGIYIAEVNLELT